MNNKIKDIRIKNHTYYFSNDIINKKSFDPNNAKIDEKLQNYSCLMHWVSGNKRFEIRKN